MTSECSRRMTDSGNPPDDAEVAAWVGKAAYRYWKRTVEWIDQLYPNVFSPEWLFGGKKHGWSLRYKKSKSFCTLIPEKGCFLLLIVFGAKERAAVDAIRNELSAGARKAYDEATTYHDGKWLLLNVDNERALADVERLLAAKRKPRPA
ncbi:MAG: DUF3788 domain-containing protein [Candidatus Hydrogenedentes bacterium]|nr:DUF3788 domain-containing protein [Candidatus Hydrogenedentota bacterium]